MGLVHSPNNSGFTKMRTHFTTGDNEHGYLLTKVTHSIRFTSINATAHIGATVNEDNGGVLGTQLYAFPDETFLATTANAQTMTHTGDLLLKPNKKYWIVISKKAGTTTSTQLSLARTNDVPTAQPEWTLATSSDYLLNGVWSDLGEGLQIRLEGVVQTSSILISNYTGAYNPGTESRRLTGPLSGTQFTTGDNEHGYLLTKVTHGMGLEAAGTGIIDASVSQDINGKPDVSLYDFPQQTITNTTAEAVTHVGEVLLEPNRKYWILVQRISDPNKRIQTYYKKSNDVGTGQTDWTLATSSDHFDGTGWVSLNSAYALRLEGLVLAPTTDEPDYRDFPMDASTPGRLQIGTTSTGTLDSVDDNVDAPEHTEKVPRGDLIKIDGLEHGHSYRVRAWFGTSKEDSATAARGGAIGLQFSRSGIELASLSPHNDNLLDDGRASFVFPAFANEEYYVDLVAPAFRPPEGNTPAHTYFGPYLLEIYDLGVTQRSLGTAGQTCTDGECTGGRTNYTEGYGIKVSGVCSNNRCYNDPRFPEFHVDGYENTDNHEVSVGNSPLSKNLLRAVAFRANDTSTLPPKFQIDKIGTFVHSMTSGSIPQAAIHAISGNIPSDKLFDLEPLYNDDRHIDYFVAPRTHQRSIKTPPIGSCSAKAAATATATSSTSQNR